ncbi:cellulose biosynthesis protein BcsP [Paraburkholderia sp. BCC1886]|uniref:cellulose biosynthesis protein BcsP n=1 Tax=Paraburkholderia sp. BCC1886 TaxID=2562670 RepID=UPI0011831542|nr:cellulose biosynthesis protein BcsP [Paraburkholderia sp. BCC1886]
MSSSSDIEKLFDHFGGDANAYQEIGRENEARTARTRWPLLVTLDLTQPTIPAIGQQSQERPPTPAASRRLALEPDDGTPKDVASVTRAKAPLFTRSHRRDIPEVVVKSAQPNAPTGASRFGDREATNEAVAREAAQSEQRASAAAAQAAQLAQVTQAVPLQPVAAIAPVPPLAVAPAAAIAPVPPLAVAPVAANAPVPPLAVAPVTAIAPVPPLAVAPAAAIPPVPPVAAIAPVASSVSAAPQPSTSILGKLFAPAPQAASPAAPAAEPAPLQSIFARLRGEPTQPAAAPEAAPATSPSWLNNGPRRS